MLFASLVNGYQLVHKTDSTNKNKWESTEGFEPTTPRSEVGYLYYKASTATITLAFVYLSRVDILLFFFSHSVFILHKLLSISCTVR